MRLIDADEVLKRWGLKFYAMGGDRLGPNGDDINFYVNGLLNEIQNAPTVGAIPNEEGYEMYNKGYMSGYERCKNERPQGEWIPVSVQEPDVGGIYFVTAKHVSGHIGTDIARRVSDNVWTFGGEELLGTEIIAWMPLPEAYKEVENESEKERL